ncbi:odv-e56 protein [Thysanoplusia orichalcea nucleopolyhedrovirus]|uniref:Odv-e56 protein n=1 Tax=Thysanoplusia orichalcea nucleopolyhedrovirus TaxID=101850 RepID=L0CLH5_9ABAC|nr:odv-e56 protein [Thysanoplusia orichalcea nucleopolyhedrovirus]AGA16295.1 odv-e56 protein [Thysanoplusia orichalcea nucleopolyhedrovirus]
MSFFTNLRRVNKVYSNQADFLIDNARLLTSTPNGFTNVIRAPSTRNIAGTNRVEAGDVLSNNQFVSTSDINRITRNNDVPNIRGVFQGISDPQINSLGQLRRVDNVPDFNYHTKQTRSNAVKQNFPETNVRTPDGVQNALQQNPRLHTYMQSLKVGGVGILLATGGYFLFSAATLVQDIINAINNTGGSYYVKGKDAGDNADACLLLQRTCRQDPNLNQSDVSICSFDPLLPNNPPELINICQGFNYEQEKTVCRASDPSANPNSLQYVDISDLPVGQTLMCIEPYSFGDLIGDLNLDWLLGEEGLVGKSSNVSDSVSDKFMPIILLIGTVLFLGLIFYFIYRYMIKGGRGGGATGFGTANAPIVIMQTPATATTSSR